MLLNQSNVKIFLVLTSFPFLTPSSTAHGRMSAESITVNFSPLLRDDPPFCQYLALTIGKLTRRWRSHV